MVIDGLQEAIFLSLAAPAFVVGSDYCFVEVNPAFEQLTGQSRAELLGRSCRDVLGSDFCSATCPVKETLATRSKCHAVKSLRVRHGEKRLLVTVTFVDLPSRPGGLAAVLLHDPSVCFGARMLDQGDEVGGADSAEHGMLRTLLEQAPHALLVVQDGRVQFGNAKAAQLAGLSPQALLYRSLGELVHPDDRLAVAESTHACLRNAPAGAAIDFRAISKGGEVRWVRSSAAAVDWNQRAAALLLLADIDEEKSAEQTHRRTEYRFKALFDNINDAIFIHDLEGRFLEVNAVACARLGYSREELLGMAIADINVSDQTAQVPKRLERLRREGHIVFETEHLRRDGTRIPTEISSRLYEYAGQPAMFSVARDITERHRLTEEIIQAQKMETIGLLAGGVAHDFNNVLGGILCLASLIHRNPGDSEKCRAHSAMIEDSVKQAAELTSRLLTLARRAPPKMRSVNLNKTIADTLEIVARTFQKEIAIEVDLAADLPAVRGDDSQLGQAMMNLCLNARDAMPAGGTLRVTTHLRPLSPDERTRLPSRTAGSGVVVVVEDTGEGISATDQLRIFEPFFTTKELGKGTGLGLSTVHWVVKNHGGFCQVDSEIGGGTRFRIVLPAHTAAAESVEASPHKGPGQGELLLVVDDDQTVRVACKSTLEDSGYRTLCAADGNEALALFQTHRDGIALVILDIIMPRMGGRSCLAALRAVNPDVKVLIISGYDPGEQALLLHRNNIPYLQKPFGVDQLTDAVRSVLDGESRPPG